MRKLLILLFICTTSFNLRAVDLNDLINFANNEGIGLTELVALTCVGDNIIENKFNEIKKAFENGTTNPQNFMAIAKKYIDQYKLANIKAGETFKGRKVIATHKDIDGQNFVQLATIGAGDCGFDSLYTKRDDAVSLLKQKVEAGDMGIIDALSSEAGPVPAEENDEAKKTRIINFLNTTLSNASAKGGRGMLLIESNIDTNGNPVAGAGGGSLNALARAQGKKLIVYTPGSDGKLVKIFEDQNPPENAEPAYVHITRGGGHYTILEKIELPQRPSFG